MIHSHNNNEHERIMDVALAIKGDVDNLYVNHHNGDEKLNNRIKLLNEKATTLIDRLEAHVRNTEPLDDVYKSYQLCKRALYWIAGISGSVLTGIILNYVKG